MTKKCRACGGPLCSYCGGCVAEGECSCISESKTPCGHSFETDRDSMTYYYEEPEEPHIGQFIRRSRQDRLMTQAELARRAGVSRTHLGGVEHGKSEPSYRVVRALCQVLGVEPWQTWEPMQDTEAIDRLRAIDERTREMLQIIRGGQR